MGRKGLESAISRVFGIMIMQVLVNFAATWSLFRVQKSSMILIYPMG